MQSLVLMGDSYGDMDRSRPAGPAAGDRHLLPLGLVQKPSSGRAENGNGTGTAAGRQHKQTPPARPAAVGGCPSALPPPPEGPPVMVLFPATLHLAIFFVPAPPATLVSAVMTLLAILGACVWGWGTVSTAGAGSGLAAGFVAGLGVRSRPVGGWGYASLVGCSIARLLHSLVPCTCMYVACTHLSFCTLPQLDPACKPVVSCSLSIILRPFFS